MTINIYTEIKRLPKDLQKILLTIIKKSIIILICEIKEYVVMRFLCHQYITLKILMEMYSLNLIKKKSYILFYVFFTYWAS